ncbi:MAG: YggS family pyridoxal phosphate-dependent enzyme [Gammaproteobacteria bacterium CG22_combo_CG10-13_8_21_14_all_40_8]|nr:MAG: YggS family pyridoxal phosphate-dependent enzyme [Gammaproteobacteria bacterium CG22_combo_CG10-13_8_21_14_all_40_8]
MSIASVSQLIFKKVADLHLNKEPIVVAVSKFHSKESIESAYYCGFRHFGESYVQEAIDKQTQLKQLEDVIWHFIGPIQSNKTRQIAENFDWVQSVDRVKLLQRLNAQRPTVKGKLNVLLQVNISGESTKSGVNKDELEPLIQASMLCENLQVRGLMCIPSQQMSKTEMNEFAQMRQLYEQFSKRFPTWDTLSMGMSDDYLQALHQGSTMIRIGSILFGERNR